jgi:hypothetical protein
MTKPTIHLNGTNKKFLYAQYDKAHTATVCAVAALRDCSPNGRDYYPQGALALRTADTEHSDRIARLEAVANELMELMEHCV